LHLTYGRPHDTNARFLLFQVLFYTTISGLPFARGILPVAHKWAQGIYSYHCSNILEGGILHHRRLNGKAHGDRCHSEAVAKAWEEDQKAFFV